MPTLKDIKTIREEVNSSKNPNYINLFESTEDILNKYGFAASMGKIQEALEGDPNILPKMQSIYDVLSTERTALVVANNTQIVWDVYNYFPILYSINNLGKSVYRITMNNLMNKLLDKDDLGRNLEQRQYLNLFSSIFFADARINSMSSSIESVIVQSIFTTYPKKIVLSATSPYYRKDEIIRDITHRISTVYSPELCNVIQQQAQLVILQEPVKPNSSWL